tara:strand:- start:1254 stop:2282 length:1029 start_codon:yes stop_codon:yes gene_type:complete
MDEITEKVLTYVSEINKLVDTIIKKSDKDIANIWSNVEIISRIAHLINQIISLDSERFRLFLHNVGNPNRLFSTSEDSQRRIIDAEGIQQWYAKSEDYIHQFTTDVFANYIYYGTYDTFSENSRDNKKKVDEIASMVNRNARFLEIGSGTGPLLRRLLRMGYNIMAIEYDEAMIHQCLLKHPEGQGRVIHADFFQYNLGESQYDVIFIESGLFMFSRIGRNKLIFELFSVVTGELLEQGLKKVFIALNQGGLFLVGVQGLMKKISIGEDMFFSMKRTQKSHSAIRELTYYRKRGTFNEKEILYKIKQEKPTRSFNDFVELAKRIGFAHISISNEKQWVILRK